MQDFFALSISLQVGTTCLNLGNGYSFCNLYNIILDTSRVGNATKYWLFSKLYKGIKLVVFIMNIAYLYKTNK